MSDRIIDALTELPVRGAVSEFTYKGYLVSMSQVFKPTSIGVFKGYFEELGFNTIEDAIEFINLRKEALEAVKKAEAGDTVKVLIGCTGHYLEGDEAVLRFKDGVGHWWASFSGTLWCLGVEWVGFKVV